MADKPIDLEKYRSIGSLRSGYKKTTKKWTHEGDHTGSYQTDHWDGRRDVTIKPQAVKAKGKTKDR